METLTLELPAMYADHHVIEVRHILSELPGIASIYASSAFQVVELHYDPSAVDIPGIKAALEHAGYSEAPLFPTEAGAAANGGSDQPTFFRHTAAYEQTGSAVSFAQQVNAAGRPLWPCPGLGAVRMDLGEDTNG